MGAEKRMADRSGTVRVYAAQTAPVIEELEKNGQCFCRERYIRKKYGECAVGFLVAYRYLAEKGEALVPKPAGAELPYWVSPDPAGLPRSETFLPLDVPRAELLLFPRAWWTRILQLRYLGETEEENARFERELKERGLTGYEIMTSRFYPEERERLLASWKKLLDPKAIEGLAPAQLQGAVWTIRREWVAEE